jgi:hypothetical protein
MSDTVDAEREAFEEAVFSQYFLSTIKRNPKPALGTGALDLVSEGCKTKADFLARDSDGAYGSDTLNSAWWAWQERAKRYSLKAAMPTEPRSIATA